MEVPEPRFHPIEVVLDVALPAVLEGPDLGLVAPDHLVKAVREERRVEVDQVDAVGRELPEDMQVVLAVQDAGLEVADRIHGSRFSPRSREILGGWCPRSD